MLRKVFSEVGNVFENRRPKILSTKEEQLLFLNLNSLKFSEELKKIFD